MVITIVIDKNTFEYYGKCPRCGCTDLEAIGNEALCPKCQCTYDVPDIETID